MINLTTGPVAILPQVTEAFSRPSISHRSPEFFDLHQNVTRALCEKLHVKQTFILTGSGTLANEVMLSQIKLRHETGLILANGEFGERLVNQANRHGISFNVLRKNWGEEFDYENIAGILGQGQMKWLLFCHCESSTGVLNSLTALKKLGKQYNCAVYTDCMSVFSAIPLDLTGVAMATASSGKAIGALAGLAFVFSNSEIISNNKLPVYFDLSHFQNTLGVPFTISSNLLAALYEAITYNLNHNKYEQLDAFSAKIYDCLKPLDIIPFANDKSRIFTIVPKDADAQLLGELLFKEGIQLSYRSNYLSKRNWIELAIFGSYSAEQIVYALDVVNYHLQKELNPAQ